MRIIAKSGIEGWKGQYPDAARALTTWYDIAVNAEWGSLHDARADFPTADGVEVKSGRIVTVFNIAATSTG